ncbi:hypothetical protein IW15_12835 [Chryseobacterium soli]|uniref:DUF4345 domain-containing protein n=1 Tax=Chryseobacterium soli TaxID=445961 RepID=A0A086A6W7_9FLAO|nr:hypothetical protein [Chryseobacterium soli]KFF12431.1 hypothetical protein IW15_12835 [Chryseobacterium soli]
MTRKFFLTIASFIATIVGIFALFFPSILQESKGTLPNNATYVWTSEVGILLMTIGIMAFLVRKEEDSKILKVFLFGNSMIQMGLFIIELLAYFNAVITKLSGIVPNLCIHILLTIGFLYFCITIKTDNINTHK